MESDSRFSVLSVSDDPDLLKTRVYVLRETGAAVVGATSRNAVAALRQGSFDAVVVCHTVTCGEAERIYDAAHAQYAKALVIRVMPFWVGDMSESKNSFDAVTSADPARLVNMVRELLQRHALSAV